MRSLIVFAEGQSVTATRPDWIRAGEIDPDPATSLVAVLEQATVKLENIQVTAIAIDSLSRVWT